MKEVSKGTKSPFVMGGAILIGGVVLFMVIRGGGAQAQNQVVQSGPSEAMQMANLQASTALQGAQIQSQTQLALASLQANAQGQETQATLLAMQAQLQTQLALADLTSERELTAVLAQVDAQRQISSQQISSQTEMLRLQVEGSIARDQIASMTSIAMSELSANTQVALGQQQADVYQQMLVAQAEATMAQARYYSEVELARIDASTQQAAIAGSTARRQSSNSLIGSIAGGILGLFSDVRLKENIRFEGFRPDGLSNYSYNYAGQSERHIGVMAQEAAELYPLAVGQSQGYLTVDYTRLN